MNLFGSNRAGVPATQANASELVNFVAKSGTVEVLVGFLALLAYVGTLAFGFVYDDKVQILENPAIRHWASALQYFRQDVWAGLGMSSTATFYRPIFMLWLRVNDSLWGLQPACWHAGAAVLHAIASILVCRLAVRLTQSRAMACAVGILFALHPVHVESVAWVSGATDSLMAIFICGATLSFLEFEHGGKRRFLAASIVLATLSLLTKEPALLLPVLLGASLLATEGWQRLSRAKSLLIFVLLDAAYLVVRAWVLHGAPALENMTIAQMIMTWPVVLTFYLGQLVLPWRLSLFHDLAVVHSPFDPRFWPALVLLLALTAALWMWARRSSRRGLIIAACVWLVVPLLPVLNLRVFTPGQLVHDRYLYLSSVGFSLLVVAAVLELLERFASGKVWDFGAALVLVTSIAYAFVVFTNQMTWASDLLLYKHSAEIAPRSSVAALDLGVAYMRKGDFDSSINWLERSTQLDYVSVDPRIVLAQAYYLDKRIPEANQCLRQALERNPRSPEGWLLASELALDSGDTQTALAAVQRAQSLSPNGPGYHAMAGIVYWRQGNKPAAEEAFRQEFAIHPDDQHARVALENLKAGK